MKDKNNNEIAINDYLINSNNDIVQYYTEGRIRYIITINDLRLGNDYPYTQVNDFEIITTNIPTVSDILNAKNNKLKQLKNSILAQFKPLLDAMTFQKISAGLGASANNEIFTDAQIKSWGDYIGGIVNYNQDLTNIDFEDINITLFGQMPSIPQQYMSLL